MGALPGGAPPVCPSGGVCLAGWGGGAARSAAYDTRSLDAPPLRSSVPHRAQASVGPAAGAAGVGTRGSHGLCKLWSTGAGWHGGGGGRRLVVPRAKVASRWPSPPQRGGWGHACSRADRGCGCIALLRDCKLHLVCECAPALHVVGAAHAFVCTCLRGRSACVRGLVWQVPIPWAAAFERDAGRLPIAEPLLVKCNDGAVEEFPELVADGDQVAEYLTAVASVVEEDQR